MHQPMTTRDDIVEALTHANATAKRAPHVLGWREWEAAHQTIDRLLGELGL